MFGVTHAVYRLSVYRYDAESFLFGLIEPGPVQLVSMPRWLIHSRCVLAVRSLCTVAGGQEPLAVALGLVI